MTISPTSNGDLAGRLPFLQGGKHGKTEESQLGFLTRACTIITIFILDPHSFKIEVDK